MIPVKNPIILIVDDVGSYRMYVKDLLCDLGYTHVLEAKNGEEALELLENYSIDLVISDFCIGPVTGLDLLKRVRESLGFTRLPFIMMTGVGDDMTLAQAETHGVTSYLKKPLYADLFEESVLNALSGCIAKSLSEKYKHLRSESPAA